MATRSYRSIADSAKAQWSAETHALSARLGAELAAEIDAQMAVNRDAEAGAADSRVEQEEALGQGDSSTSR